MIKALDTWRVSCHSAIKREASLKLGGDTFTMRTWDRIVNYYFIDLANDVKDKASIHSNLVLRIFKDTGISQDRISAILESVKTEAISSVSMSSAVIEYTSSRRSTSFKIGSLTFSLPPSIFERLIRRCGGSIESVGRLLLRYYPFRLSEGFFWSMDARVYDKLRDTHLPTIEGFASPFNHNLENYCSVYASDSEFGALGNFFKYIDLVDFPVRLIANPPYTNEVIDHAVDVVISFLNRVPGSECIMMLPVWPKNIGIQRLIEYPGSEHVTFETNEYTLHDYTVDKVITPRMSMSFFILSSPGTVASIDIEELSSLIRSAHMETSVFRSLSGTKAKTRRPPSSSDVRPLHDAETHTV